MKAKAVVAAVTLLAIWCAPARADDATLYRAFQSHDHARTHALHVFLRASRRFNRSPSAPRGRAVIAADRRFARVLAKIVKEIQREQPSSDAGAKAKPLAISGMREWRYMQMYDAHVVRAYLRGDAAAQRRWDRRFKRAAKRSQRHLVAAEAAFKDAGFPRGP
jgi:hypothetical protein